MTCKDIDDEKRIRPGDLCEALVLRLYFSFWVEMGETAHNKDGHRYAGDEERPHLKRRMDEKDN